MTHCLDTIHERGHTNQRHKLTNDCTDTTGSVYLHERAEIFNIMRKQRPTKSKPDGMTSFTVRCAISDVKIIDHWNNVIK